MAQPAKQENMDYLKLSENESIKKLIENEGIGDKEKIIYSEKITKINRKGKKQDRYLMITNKAVYNLKPKKYNKSKRRVALRDLSMITLSALSPEFAVHVTSEYDYHLCSKSKDKITEVLTDLYKKETMGNKLLVVYSELKHLKDIIVTKKLAKFEVFVPLRICDFINILYFT